jgi:hypothetical protein
LVYLQTPLSFHDQNQREYDGDAPSFTESPRDLTVNVGESAAFYAGVNGTQQLSCQWQKDGVNLPGETTGVLAIPSCVPADAGQYTLVATNSCGTSESRAATLTVIQPCVGDIAPDQPGGNGIVDIDDLFAVIGAWGLCPEPCPPCTADLDGNCEIDIDDLFTIIAGWGPCD